MKERSLPPDRTQDQPIPTGETPFSLPSLDNQDSDDTIKDFKLYSSAIAASRREDAAIPAKEEAYRIRSRAKNRGSKDSI